MIGVRLSVVTMFWGSVLVAASGLVYPYSNEPWARAVLVALGVGLVTTFVTIRGGSTAQWIARRWRVRAPLTLARMVDAKGRAMVWDGTSASMFIELYGNPWAISVVDGNGDTTTTAVPLQELRSYLRQFDIVLRHVRIIEYGYKFATNDRAAAAVASAVDTVGHLLGGRTFVEVSVSLLNNPNPVAARQKAGDTVADGLTRTVSIATDRILRVFQTSNITARIVSPASLAALQRDIMGGVQAAASHNHWSYAGVHGDSAIGTVVSFVPARGSWSDLHQHQWNEVSAYRQYTCMTVSPEGDSDRVEYATTYLVDDPDVLRLLPSQGLRRENGRHVARLSNVSPMVCDSTIDDDGSILLPRDHPTELSLRTHALGVFLGFAVTTRKQVFLHVARGDSPLWIVGDDEFARRLVLRLSTQRYRVAVSLRSEEWDHLVSSRKSKRLVTVTNPLRAMAASDVVVCDADSARDMTNTADGPAVIVVTNETQAAVPRYSVIRDGDVLHVRSQKVTVDVVRENPPTERPWLELPAERVLPKETRTPAPATRQAPPTAAPPRQAPPTEDRRQAPPRQAPPTAAPPRQSPPSPTAAPTRQAPPRHGSPTEDRRQAPPRQAPPPPTAAPPRQAPPTEDRQQAPPRHAGPPRERPSTSQRKVALPPTQMEREPRAYNEGEPRPAWKVRPTPRKGTPPPSDRR